MSIVAYIAVMAGVTYLIRMIPFTLFRRKIKSRFLNSVLFYIPFAVLSAMTFPAILFSTGDMLTASIGTAVALILSFFDMPLIVVSLSAVISALLAGMII